MTATTSVRVDVEVDGKRVDVTSMELSRGVGGTERLRLHFPEKASYIALRTQRHWRVWALDQRTEQEYLMADFDGVGSCVGPDGALLVEAR